MKKYNADELLKNNLIDDETYERIVNFEKNKTSEKMTINLFFNILAGILLALGIIWIVAANWHNIPNSLRLTTVFTCAILNAFLIYKMKQKGKNLEAPSIVYVGLCIASIALIGQTFNIAASTDKFLLVCVFFMGIVTFYTKSKLLSYAYMIFGTIYLFYFPNIVKVFFNLPSNSIFYIDEIGIIISTILYAIIPICYMKLVLEDKENKNEEAEGIHKNSLKLYERSVKRYSKFLIDTIAILLVEYSIIALESFGMFVIMLMILYTAFNFFKLKTERKLCSIIIMGYLLFYSMVAIEYKLDFNMHVVLIMIIYAAVMIYQFVKFEDINKLSEKDKDDLNLKNKLLSAKNDLILLSSGIIIVLNIILVTFADEGGLINELFETVYLIYLIIFAIYLIVNGIKHNRLSDFNFGELIFAVEIFRFIFLCSDDLMLRGILSIAIAIVILVVNKKVTKKMKETKEKLENAKEEVIENNVSDNEVKFEELKDENVYDVNVNNLKTDEHNNANANVEEIINNDTNNI